MAMPPPPLPEATSETSEVPITQAHTLLTSFSSFLTISIHTILYYRDIYPRQTFLSAKAYNLPVHQSRHPKVCSWIRDAVDAVTGQMATGNVARVAVVIHAPLTSHGTAPSKNSISSSKTSVSPPKSSVPPAKFAVSSSKSSVSPSESPGPGNVAPTSKSAKVEPGAVLERWMFDVSKFPSWPGGADAMRNFNAREGGSDKPLDEEEEDDVAGADDNPANETIEEDVINWADVDEQLRGALRRLAYAGEKMEALPEGCTFTVAVELKNEGQAPIGHPQPWIPSQPSLQASRGQSTRSTDLGGASAIPVRSVEAGPLFFECWVEEGKAKERLRNSARSQPTRPS